MKKRKKKIKNRSRIAFLEKRIKQLEQKAVIQNKLNNEIVSFIKFTAESDFKNRIGNDFKHINDLFDCQAEINKLFVKDFEDNDRKFVFTWLMIILLGVAYVIS